MGMRCSPAPVHRRSNLGPLDLCLIECCRFIVTLSWLEKIWFAAHSNQGVIYCVDRRNSDAWSPGCPSSCSGVEQGIQHKKVFEPAKNLRPHGFALEAYWDIPESQSPWTASERDSDSAFFFLKRNLAWRLISTMGVDKAKVLTALHDSATNGSRYALRSVTRSGPTWTT